MRETEWDENEREIRDGIRGALENAVMHHGPIDLDPSTLNSAAKRIFGQLRTIFCHNIEKRNYRLSVK